MVKAQALGFNPDTVVHCVLQPLPTAEVLFRSLYAHAGGADIPPCGTVKKPGQAVARPRWYRCWVCPWGAYIKDNVCATRGGRRP